MATERQSLDEASGEFALAVACADVSEQNAEVALTEGGQVNEE